MQVGLDAYPDKAGGHISLMPRAAQQTMSVWERMGQDSALKKGHWDQSSVWMPGLMLTTIIRDFNYNNS